MGTPPLSLRSFSLVVLALALLSTLSTAQQPHWKRAYSMSAGFKAQIEVSIKSDEPEGALRKAKSLLKKHDGVEIAYGTERIGHHSNQNAVSTTFVLASEKADELARKILTFGDIVKFHIIDTWPKGTIKTLEESLAALQDEVDNNQEALQTMPIASAMLTEKIDERKKSLKAYKEAVNKTRIRVNIIIPNEE